MNLQTETLAKQAAEYAIEFATQDQALYIPKLMEKFAELIVKECIQVGGPEDSYTDEWFKAKADSVNKIREHFGVEK